MTRTILAFALTGSSVAFSPLAQAGQASLVSYSYALFGGNQGASASANVEAITLGTFASVEACTSAANNAQIIDKIPGPGAQMRVVLICVENGK
jgi:hypothetical protein